MGFDEQIEQKKKEIKELEDKKRKLSKLRTLESYSVEEKCEKFDELFKQAQGILNEKFEKGWYDDDNDNYCFESIMELLGKDIWKVLN